MTTEKELGEALKNNEDTIVVEGDLAKKVIKIGATGNAVWVACIICIAVAVAATIVTISSAGTATLVTGPAASVGLGFAATALGMPTAITATGIAIAGGGVNALNKLRNYRLEKISDMKIILHKK